ncbi:hypothetical protein [Roseospirillum parvum]|uniref:Uncharacterized protein n=1 Tax=Roseospirillum parvum TaxID=83401 RepID=A0A1G8BQJ2_9PROT|nr:hypothetical protein [Roseospirillum parvum]SDH35363.1 hypothetical protein SAMN05421742_10695 [Roseospirillum parvum]
MSDTPLPETATLEIAGFRLSWPEPLANSLLSRWLGIDNGPEWAPDWSSAEETPTDLGWGFPLSAPPAG